MESMMGGNALKQYETRRLDRAEYEKFTEVFSEVFERNFGFKPLLIKAYRQKESFGDADYLVTSEKLKEGWIDSLKEVFKLSDEQVSKNGNVLSIGVDILDILRDSGVGGGFQVDLIITPQVELAFADFYFSYNDFGNLIGRITHKLGVKIGHGGIFLVVRKDTHILEEILLSREVKDVFHILGLNPWVYYQGFETLEGMFEYVASSSYFDSAIYTLEHRSNTSRVRDRKRISYSKFLKWVEEAVPTSNHSFEDKSEKGGYSIRYPYYTTVVLEKYPWVEKHVEGLLNEYELEQKFKEVYHGNLVQRLTGFSGKTLGSFMGLVRVKLTRELKQKCIEDPRLVELVVNQTWIENGGARYGMPPLTEGEQGAIQSTAQEVYQRMAGIKL